MPWRKGAGIKEIRISTEGVTRRKTVEEGHRASEQLFTEFFDNAMGILWIKDLEGRFVKVNGPTACAMGRPVEEIIGRTVADLVSPAEAEIYSRNDQEAIRSGRAVNFTETMQLPDGLHIYRVAKFPLRDARGEICGVGAICTDVTAQKRTELALWDSDAAFRGFFERLTVGAAQLGRHGRFVRVNDRYCGITGYSREELLAGMSPLDLDHPEERERDRERIKNILAGKSCEIEKRYVRKDGRVIWVRVNVSSIVDADGRFICSVAVIEDITERKEAEAALRAREQELQRVLDTAATGLARITREFHYIFANPVYAELVGAPLEEILRGRIGDVVGPKALEAIQPYIDRVLDGERVDFEMEVPFARGNRHLHVIGTPDEDPEGQIEGWFVSLTDISERKALEREVLRISEEERRRIATDLHDGICQELIAVGFAARGLERQLEKEGHSLAARIKVITEGVSQAAAHTRLVAHGLNPIISGDDGLMHALRDLAAETSKASPVRCLFECDAPVSIPDPLVSNQLYLIAREAIQNSTKHSGAKRIRVELTEANREICLAVWDDGCGLPIDVTHRSGFGLRGMKYRRRTNDGPEQGGGRDHRELSRAEEWVSRGALSAALASGPIPICSQSA